MQRLILTLVGCCVLTSSAWAGGKSAHLVYETWDTAYLQGKRSGYVHTTVHQLDMGENTSYRTTMNLVLNVKRFNSKIQLRMDQGTVENKEGKVTGVFMRQYLGTNKKLDLTGKVDGKQLILMLDGKTRLKPAPWNDRVVGQYRQQTLFQDKKVKPGDDFSYLSFEPSINLVVKTHVEVKDYETVELFGGQIKKKLLRVETTPEKVQKVQLPTMVTWLNKEREPIRSQVMLPGLGKMTLYRTTKAGATAPSTAADLTDIGLGQLITVNQQIPQPYTTASAVYRIRLKGLENPSTGFSNNLRQKVKKVQGDTIVLHVQAGPSAKSKKIADEFLQSSYFINCDDKRVKQLARLAVGSEKDPWKKALRIEKWINRNMRGRNREAMATADHVARTLQGDCSEFSMLMAAMCRAQKIPSRTAIGLIYADVARGPVFSYHMWTEVWIGGQWIALDATLGRGYVGATHLKITDHSWHDTRSLTPMLPLLRVLGKVSIEVVSAEQKRP